MTVPITVMTRQEKTKGTCYSNGPGGSYDTLLLDNLKSYRKCDSKFNLYWNDDHILKKKRNKSE